MVSTKAKRAVIYSRISVANEESVSIDRQIESCRKYAESQGWEILGDPFIDDGVSATHNKPERRKSWQAVLASPVEFDVVLVWKIDRLARRTIDFLHAHDALKDRGAAVVSATEQIDMTTGQGKAFATMLAVFAEMEADNISARVAAARSYLLRAGRVVGGTVPYGYRSVPNPDGQGYVLVQDPETIDYVIEAATSALGGATVYSIQQYLSENAPLPMTSQANRKRTEWHYATVERMLRHPILAGMTTYNPGNAGKRRGDGVLRDEEGMPVVDESLAVLTVAQRQQLLAILDDKTSPQRRPRAEKGTTSPLLAGLATCAHCDRPMVRGTTAGRPMLTCPDCFQTISMTQLVPYIEARLLEERGEEHGVEELASEVDDRPGVAEIEDAIRNVTAQFGADDADMPALLERLGDLKDRRIKARAAEPARVLVVRKTVVRDEWEAATTDIERREVLASQLRSLHIARGRVGRYMDPERVRIAWKSSWDFEEGRFEMESGLQSGDAYALAE